MLNATDGSPDHLIRAPCIPVYDMYDGDQEGEAADVSDKSSDEGSDQSALAVTELTKDFVLILLFKLISLDRSFGFSKLQDSF